MVMATRRKKGNIMSDTCCVATVLAFRRKQHKQEMLALCCFGRNANTVATQDTCDIELE